MLLRLSMCTLACIVVALVVDWTHHAKTDSALQKYDRLGPKENWQFMVLVLVVSMKRGEGERVALYQRRSICTRRAPGEGENRSDSNETPRCLSRYRHRRAPTGEMKAVNRIANEGIYIHGPWILFERRRVDPPVIRQVNDVPRYHCRRDCDTLDFEAWGDTCSQEDRSGG